MPQRLYHATLACSLDPKAAFLRLRHQQGCVWLDSARSNPQGDARYSLVAANPISRLRYYNGQLEQIDYIRTDKAATTTAPPSPTPTTTPCTDPLTALERWLSAFGRTHAVTSPEQTPAATPDATSPHSNTEASQATAVSESRTADSELQTGDSESAFVFFRGGAVGYFSYEFGRQWEKHTPLPEAAAGFPQMDWALYDCALVCDHQSGVTQIIACATADADTALCKAQAFLRLLQQAPTNDGTLPPPPPAAPATPPAPAPATATPSAPATATPSAPAPANIALSPATPPVPATIQPATAKSAQFASAGAPRTNDIPHIADDAAQASDARRAAYMSAVEEIRGYIAQGDIYQANIAQHFDAPLHEHPADLYLRLRDLNPAPYAAYIDTGKFQILSSSPELFLQKRGSHVLTRPIKGTRPRGHTPQEDARLRKELSLSEKERAELLMIVDLERNDLGRVCLPGSVRVESLYRIETYATVHHLLADVCGTLKPDTSLNALLRATFPGGSITGAPKVRAMEIIDELEGRERGIFCGAIGLLGTDATVCLNIAIRTLLCDWSAQGGRVQVSVGAGLVWDSDPLLEYEETLHKAEALLKAIHSQPHRPV